MIKIFRKNWEILCPIFISIFAFIIFLHFKFYIYNSFIEKNINAIILNISLALTGFILTAYTIFLGFQNHISKKIKESYILNKIDYRFRFSLYLSIFFVGS